MATSDGPTASEVAEVLVSGGTASYGSGYRIGPSLVLTARHVIDVPGVLTVRFGGHSEAAECVWRGEVLDVAVLRLHRPIDVVQSARLGDVGSALMDQLPFTAVGFPKHKQRPRPGGGAVRDTDVVRGEIPAGANAKVGVLDLLRDGRPLDVGEAWKGMSGAAVFSWGLLVGVVIEAEQTGSLRAVRISAALGKASSPTADRESPEHGDRLAGLLAEDGVDAQLSPVRHPAAYGPRGSENAPGFGHSYFVPRADGHARQFKVSDGNYKPFVSENLIPPSLALQQLPADISDFTGRTAAIQVLESIIGHGNGKVASVLNIYGPPGVGKSTLSVHLAHRLASSEKLQLYFDFGLTPNLEMSEVLAQVVSTLSPQEVVAGGLNELRGRYLSWTKDIKSLVLLDNAQDAAYVRPLIPNSKDATVIVTSRKPLSGLAGASLWRLELLEANEAVELLSRVSGRPRNIDPVDSQVVSLCGRLPLAVRIAGAIAKKRPFINYATLVDLLRDERTRLATLKVDDLDVRGAFELSYNTLDKNVKRAFGLASLCVTSQFSVVDFAHLLDLEERVALDVACELVDAQLFETDDGSWFRMHDLLALFSKEKRTEDLDNSEVAAAHERLISHLHSEFISGYRAAVGTTRWLIVSRRFEGAGYVHTSFDGNDRQLPYIEQHVHREGVSTDWRHLLRAHKGSRVLIFGGPGSGKTTLAERICFDLAKEGGRRIALSMPMRHFAGGSLIDAISASVGRRFNLRLTREVLLTLFARNSTTLILDSLDELPRDEWRRAVSVIEEFCLSHSNVNVIITTRSDTRLRDGGIRGFVAYELELFSRAEISQFADRWLDPTDNDARNEFEALARSARWLANPLLLSWVVANYRYHRVLPRSEIELHDMTFEIALGGRDARRGINRVISSSWSMGELAAWSAFWLKSDADRIAGVPQAELIRQLEPMARTDGAPAAFDLLIELGWIYESGMSPSGEPIYTIVQDSFGEYLAARWICIYNHHSLQSSTYQTVVDMMAAGRFDSGWKYAIELAERAQHGFSREEFVSNLRRAVLNLDVKGARKRVIVLLESADM